MADILNFPAQALSANAKNKAWRKKCVEWGANKATYFNQEIVRNSVNHKIINYNLIDGKVNIHDMELILNPTKTQASYIPTDIQHYPIMNSRLNVLQGEESKRLFDYKVVVTNPNAISEIEQNKKNAIFQQVQELVQSQSQSEEEFNQRIAQMGEFFNYEWQDLRELRANCLLNHYVKELDMPSIFNKGFMDAMTVGEEIYQVDIVSGEPTLRKLNPCKVRAFKAGYSSNIEDADIIVIEDYWNPSRIIDEYHEYLSPKDIKKIEEYGDSLGGNVYDDLGNVDERYGFIPSVYGETSYLSTDFFNIYDGSPLRNTLLPSDFGGNIRVVKVYWKSLRKIKKIKFYDTETGEVDYKLETEDYILKEDQGEEEKIMWVNEAWEGTLIGKDIYINIRPRVVQFNRMSNPSRCHFGIIGSIYNKNENKPFSLVDMMKPYSYLYDAVHNRLNKLIANNWGKILRMDFAKIPKGWDIEKWMYFVVSNNIAVENSYNEGQYGAAAGKLAGALNNNNNGVLDMELGNSIQSYISLLEYIKSDMGDVGGVNNHRLGQIANRETVGGVERATLQSSHITEWLFITHENLKKRVLEAFLEVAKIALKGNTMKFEYILPDKTSRIIDIDGDDFAECDYGLVVDNSDGLQKLQQQLEGLAQAALQNNMLNFSSLMKLYTSNSIAEKIRIVEKTEQGMLQQRQQEMQQQQELAQQQIQANAEQQQREMQFKDAINQRDNETKIMVAEINSQAEMAVLELKNHMTEEDQLNNNGGEQQLEENKRQFDARLKLDRDKFDWQKTKETKDQQIKLKSINKPKNK